MKTPEQMAEEHANLRCPEQGAEFIVWCMCRDDFLAGYQAAKDEEQAKMQELEANWKFCCEDKARLLNELAVAERAKDQLADADKVMPQWISVKERLPEPRVLVLYLHELHGPSVGYYDPQYPKPGYTWISNEWGDNNIAQISHWMPLPEAPKGEA